MRIRTWLITFVASGGTLMACICFLGLYSVRDMNERTRQHFELASLMHESGEAALGTQVRFMNQVREWNNLLMRGYDEPSYDRHLRAFLAEEKAVGEALEALRQLM